MNRPVLRLLGALFALAIGAIVLTVSAVSIVQLPRLLMSGQPLGDGQQVAVGMLATGVAGLVLIGCLDRHAYTWLRDQVRTVLTALFETVASGGRR